VLRPHPQPQPVGPQFSSDPARVAEIFTGLIAAAQATDPVRIRRGQLLYVREDRIRTDGASGELFRTVYESWVEAPGLLERYSEIDGGSSNPDLLAEQRAAESARDPRPAGSDTRPWVTFRVNRPADPAAARKLLVDMYRADGGSDDDKVFSGATNELTAEPFLLPAWRLALYRALADLPVSVAETTAQGRQLVTVRFVVDGGDVHELLFDPSTGRCAGFQYVWLGTAPLPSLGPQVRQENPEAPSEPVVARTEVDPGVHDRSLRDWAIVEDVGERP
jgi:hypothetical protein